MTRRSRFSAGAFRRGTAATSRAGERFTGAALRLPVLAVLRRAAGAACFRVAVLAGVFRAVAFRAVAVRAAAFGAARLAVFFAALRAAGRAAFRAVFFVAFAA